MGPRRRSRGRPPPSKAKLVRALRRSSLLWGHDEGVVEARKRAFAHCQRLANGAVDEGVVEGSEAVCLLAGHAFGFQLGATTKESWKASERQSPMSTIAALQWGHDEGVVEGATCPVLLPRPLTCFNWATTKESWKACQPESSFIRIPLASIGPRRRSRGRRLSMSYLADDEMASIGPRRRSRGRHGFDNPVRAGEEASIGPRRTSRGRHVPQGIAIANDRRFNWATTKESWKAFRRSKILAWLDALQWGHDEGVVEAQGQCRTHDESQYQAASDGATTKESWKASLGGFSLNADASMGPRRRCRKAFLSATGCTASLQLYGP